MEPKKKEPAKKREEARAGRKGGRAESKAEHKKAGAAGGKAEMHKMAEAKVHIHHHHHHHGGAEKK